MKRLLTGIAAAAAASAALTTAAAPYEDYRIQIQRAQEARLRIAKQAPAAGRDAHVPMMQEMNRQLQDARTVDQMSPEQMRAWIKEHVGLMDQMHQQMMGGDGISPRHAQ